VTGAVRVLLADDNPVLRMGMASLLAADERIDLVAEAADGQEAVELAARHRPDVVILDVRMPELDGVAAAARMPEGTRVLMLTYSDEPDVITAAMRSGAHGYLVHGAHTPDEILNAVVASARGLAVFGPAASAVLFDPGRMQGLGSAQRAGGSDRSERAARHGLTPREVEILDMVADGHTNRQIATACFLAEKTVKNHINRIFAKLQVATRAEAVSLWLRDSSAV
jgi:DNA-binding NarL/FixJ family response regulator